MAIAGALVYLIANVHQKRNLLIEYYTANKVDYHVFHYWYGMYRANKTNTESFLPVTATDGVSKEQITIVGLSGIKAQIPINGTAHCFCEVIITSLIMLHHSIILSSYHSLIIVFTHYCLHSL